MLRVVNDVEYRDLEYPSIKDTNYNPLNLKGLQVNKNNSNSDLVTNAQELEQASQYNEVLVESNLELIAIPTQLFNNLD